MIIWNVNADYVLFNILILTVNYWTIGACPKGIPMTACISMAMAI